MAGPPTRAGEPALSPPSGGSQPVFIVCSRQPGVGRTLIARLLVEYLIVDGRRPLAFDVSPEDRALAHHLPLLAIRASVGDTRGQMALFDRLIVNDGTPKVVDLAADMFDPFFDVISKVGFLGEARARSIDIVVLFVATGDRRSEDTYGRLLLRRGLFTVVPVDNAINHIPASTGRSALPGTLPPMRVGLLPQSLRRVIDTPGFLFADALGEPTRYPAPLHQWTARAFVAIRDLELRLQMAAFGDLFKVA